MLNSIQTKYDAPLNVEFGKLKEVMEWCRSNCISNWYIHEVNPGLYPYEVTNLGKNFNNYVFQFDNEKDLIVFNLKWK